MSVWFLNILGVRWKLLSGEAVFNLHGLMNILFFFFFFFFGGVNTYSMTNHMFREASVNELIVLVVEFDSKVGEDLC